MISCTCLETNGKRLSVGSTREEAVARLDTLGINTAKPRPVPFPGPRAIGCLAVSAAVVVSVSYTHLTLPTKLSV